MHAYHYISAARIFIGSLCTDLYHAYSQCDTDYDATKMMYFFSQINVLWVLNNLHSRSCTTLRSICGDLACEMDWSIRLMWALALSWVYA